jgi:hypothetical protein
MINSLVTDIGFLGRHQYSKRLNKNEESDESTEKEITDNFEKYLNEYQIGERVPSKNWVVEGKVRVHLSPKTVVGYVSNLRQWFRWMKVGTINIDMH